jgi:enterochelin esterase-like enzyme
LIPLITLAEEESRTRKFFESIGSVSRITVESDALKGNLFGDPLVRVVDVYMPAGHNGQGLPLLVDLVGFTSSGLSHTNWVGFRENLPERLDRLIGEQRMPPVVLAFPDCFTRLDGNQYINSASTGAWEDFLLHEMLPAIEQRFGCGGPGRRGVFGKSSGGYGAITHALRHSDIWAGRGLSFRRYGLRAMLSARHASGAARTCRRRELDRAVVAAA